MAVRSARNISRLVPAGRGLSVAVTVTAVVAPNIRPTGWRSTASARNPTATPKPDPITAAPITPTAAARRAGSRVPHRQVAAHHPAATTVHRQASAGPARHTIPAAVTAHAVSAAGTSRRSTRPGVNGPGVTP